MELTQALRDQITTLQEMVAHLKHQNVGMLQILQHSSSGTPNHEHHVITKPLDEVLAYHNLSVTDADIFKLIDASPPAIANIATLVSYYTKDESIIYNKRANTFKFLDRTDIITISYTDFFQRVMRYIYTRLKILVQKRNQEVSEMITKKSGSTEAMELEYTNDTNRIQNMNLLVKLDTIEKIYVKYKNMYV